MKEQQLVDRNWQLLKIEGGAEENRRKGEERGARNGKKGKEKKSK